LRNNEQLRTNTLMENDPNAALAHWAVAQFDACNRVMQTLWQAPLPDGPLHAWAIETLAWASSATDAIKVARTQLTEAPPPSAPDEVASALRATASASLGLFELNDAFVTALRSAASDIACGRANEINETAAKSIEDLPWLLLESQRLRFMAGGQTLGEHDPVRWFLLARAHAYAVRRDLEELERQAELGMWFESDANSMTTGLAAMQDAIRQGQSLVVAKLGDASALAEHPSAGDLLRSYGQSFATLANLSQGWSASLAEAPSGADDRLAAVEDACTAFSYADAELDRQLARRADIMRAIR
jgi:hypothetical protein